MLIKKGKAGAGQSQELSDLQERRRGQGGMWGSKAKAGALALTLRLLGGHRKIRSRGDALIYVLNEMF